MNFQLLYNTLVKVDADETTYIPDLADTWEVSPDATTFTFHLNPNAKWHDGTPVTADDVIFTAATGRPDRGQLRRHLSHHELARGQGRGRGRGHDEHPRGPRQGRRQHRRVHARGAQRRLAAEPHRPGLHDHAQAPARAVHDRRRAQGVRLRERARHHRVRPLQARQVHARQCHRVRPRNADYHKGAPKIPQAHLRARRATRTPPRRSSRPASWTWCSTSSRATSTCSTASRGHQGQAGARRRAAVLQFPVTNPLVADKRVRQAIYYAFDRKTLLETVFQGAGKLLWIWLSFDETDPELDKYEFNPDKAKELIAAAEADGSSTRRKPLRIIYIADEPGWDEIARRARERPARNVGPQPASSSRPTRPAGRPSCRTRPRTRSASSAAARTSTRTRPRAPSTARRPSGRFYANCELDALFAAARRPATPPSRREIYDADRRASSTRTSPTTGCGPSPTPTPTRPRWAASPTTRTPARRSRRSRSGRWRR